MIPPDDLRPGDWVTRHVDLRKQRDVNPAFNVEGDTIRRCDFEMDAGVLPGIPLRIRGVSYPYVVCSVLFPGGAEGQLEILDVRKDRLVALDDSYVSAISRFDPDVELNESDLTDV